MKQIVVLGAGFAGLWSAVGAQRRLRELELEREARIIAVNKEPYHNIRVRNYEADLSGVCVPLADVLPPIGVETVLGEVVGLEPSSQTVQVRCHDGARTIAYDRLVLALGSQLVRPPVPGLREFAFDVDTYRAAIALNDHLTQLSSSDKAGRAIVVVVGAGLTGLEVATEMPGRLAAIFKHAADVPKVFLVDQYPFVGSDMGDHARPVIEQALAELGIELRLSTTVSSIEPDRVLLSSGEEISSCTVVWCAGMRANPLGAQVPAARDGLGRLHVDEFMRVKGLGGVFAAGDIASVMVDSDRCSVMSCQHGRPMGRYAGHNVISDLFGHPMLPLSVDWYATVVDLGPWGAIYTKGFDRQVFATGASAKETKRIINRQRIYPPRSRNPDEILAAAAPVIQEPPVVSINAPTIGASAVPAC